MMNQGFRLVVLACLLMRSSVAQSQIKVFVLGYESSQKRDDEARIDILGSDPRFDTANSISPDGYLYGLPSLATLQNYDSVLVWPNVVPDTTTQLSDRLADYVDGGGRVVIATFWGQAVATAGRLNTHGYNPFTNPTPDANTPGSLGSFDSSDPLFAGVSSLTATLYRGDYLPGLDPGATLAGSWDDGRPLAGYSANHRVINITLYPDVYQYVHASGDYRELFRNALSLPLVVPSGQVPEPGAVTAVAGLLVFGILMVWRCMRVRVRTGG